MRAAWDLVGACAAHFSRIPLGGLRRFAFGDRRWDVLGAAGSSGAKGSKRQLGKAISLQSAAPRFSRAKKHFNIQEDFKSSKHEHSFSPSQAHEEMW